MVTLVQQYLERSARRFGDRVAVACDRDSITYLELDARTSARARELQRRGLERGAFVPLYLDKNIKSIEGILSILKADCAYVPLDVGSPARRIEEILRTTAAKFVLVNDASLERFRENYPRHAELTLVNLDREPDAPSEPIDYRNLSIDVAYALFTSGSTGTPKGVMISHQMIIDYIEWCVELYGLSDRDVIANHAPLYFDNSTFDLYTAFRTGASLHLVYNELNVILTRLIPWLRDHEITVFFCVPSLLGILLRSGRLKSDSFPKLRHVIAAGEVLPPGVVRQWMQLFPHVQFTNMYGPTEITVDCTFHIIREPPPPDATAIPIGRSRRNMEVLLLGEDGSLTDAPGSEGEIVVRGASVSYGYLNDPERTRDAFIQNPRHSLYHDPLYKTGDLARIAPDGSFLFMGRRDHQIKYMGNRIELGEIESTLLSIDGVLDCVVVFNDSSAMEQKCIGALLCLESAASRSAVCAELEKRLPPYMVPRRVVVASELPLLPNGKLDRRAAFHAVFGES